MSTEKKIVPAVAAAIFNEKGEILLQKRRDVKKWCVISGHVEFGETVEQALLREIKEEINAPAEIIRLIGIYSSPQSQTYRHDETVVQYVTSYFEVLLKDDVPPDYSKTETIELRFFPTDATPEDLATINAHWLSDALNRTSKAFIR